MKKPVTGFFIALTIVIFTVPSFATSSPVILSHTLITSSKGATVTKLEYSLHVENAGENPLDELSLTLVSIPPLVAKKTTVIVGYLGPHQSTDVTLQIVTPAFFAAESYIHAPLHWAGKYRNVAGKPAEFPAKSKLGGGR